MQTLPGCSFYLHDIANTASFLYPAGAKAMRLDWPDLRVLSIMFATGTGSQLKGSTVSLSSLVGPEALAQLFNEVDLAKTSAQQLWEQARYTCPTAELY